MAYWSVAEDAGHAVNLREPQDHAYSAATICCVRHCPSKARSDAGLTGLLSTAMFSSRAAAR